VKLTSTATIRKSAIALRALARGIFSTGARAQLAKHLSSFVEEEALYAQLRRLDSPRRVPASRILADEFPEGLFVSTSSGLFLLDNGQWTQLLETKGYGVAVAPDGRVFAVCSPGEESVIVRARLKRGSAGAYLADASVLCRFETRYHPERIHQIAWDSHNGRVLCANTRRNSLLSIDPDSGAFVDEFFPFCDRFGGTIWTDHNHVNGIAAHYGKLLFSAHTVGANGSALGFVDGRRVRLYGFEGRGVHDILLHDGGVVFSDSFRLTQRALNPAVSGTVMRSGEAYLSPAIDAIEQQVMIRGITLRGQISCIGASTYTRRDKRSDNSGGGLLVFRGGELLEHIRGPFSQVYDVLPVNGEHTDKPSPDLDGDALDALFRRDVGPCIYDQVVEHDPFVPPLR
jgi:hypothetical protein